MFVLHVAYQVEALTQSQGYLRDCKRHGVIYMDYVRYRCIRLAAGMGGVQDRLPVD